MDPKELANLQIAQQQKDAAAMKAAKDAQVDREKARADASAAANKALKEVVVPYFDEIKAAMQGDFTYAFDSAVGQSGSAGVTFSIKNRAKASIISVGGGVVQSHIHTRTVIIYSEIKSTADLTRDKLGEFVKTIIEG